MTQSTMSPQLTSLQMTNKVYYRRLHELVHQLANHPHRDEIMQLAYEQLADDHDTVDFAYANTCPD